MRSSTTRRLRLALGLVDEAHAAGQQLAHRAVAAGTTEDEGDRRQQALALEPLDDLGAARTATRDDRRARSRGRRRPTRSRRDHRPSATAAPGAARARGSRPTSRGRHAGRVPDQSSRPRDPPLPRPFARPPRLLTQWESHAPRPSLPRMACTRSGFTVTGTSPGATLRGTRGAKLRRRRRAAVDLLDEEVEHRLTDHHVLPERHRPVLGDDDLRVTAHLAEPGAELLGVAHGRRQRHDADVGRQVDDDLLPHGAAEAVGEVVDLVHDDPAEPTQGGRARHTSCCAAPRSS